MRDACIDKRELALIDLLISTGLRVSEISNVALSEIDWENRVIIIHGKGGKDRVVPFSVRCKKHMQEYLMERGRYLSHFLFCSNKKPYNKLCKGSINKIVKNIGTRVGLPEITVHCFRRWLASDLNKKGVDPLYKRSLAIALLKRPKNTISINRRIKYVICITCLPPKERFMEVLPLFLKNKRFY